MMRQKRQKTKKRKSTPLTLMERIFVVVAILFVSHVSFPQLTHGVIAASPKETVNYERAFVFNQGVMKGAVLTAAERFYGPFITDVPSKPEQNVAWTTWVLVTAYSSTPDQTDDTPFIGAAGTFVRDGMIAANWLRFGTRVRMPEYFGDKEFFVEDRMHTRFSDRVDIWMTTREAATDWGARWVQVEVLK
jgi:3D (Asp-Asp-Asp) domain-containing protein